MNLVTEVPPLPRRDPDTHKGDYGRLLFLTGSETMSGAAILAARAAYRAGAGLVRVAIDRKLFGVISPAVPEAVFHDASRGPDGLPEEVLRSYHAALLGPGIGTTRSRVLLTWILDKFIGPAVLDADAVNLLASLPVRKLRTRQNWVWTPHPGEFARLTGEAPRGDEERVAAARRFVEARGGVLVLKGHHTVVMDRERYAINATGNPGMATAGTGDVLGGMLAAFLGQGVPPFEAARLAVHLHGLAGDLAAAELGVYALVATDLIEYFPHAMAGHPVKESPWKKH